MSLPTSTIIGTDTSQANEYSLPGSPDLRQITHTSLGNWLNFRPTLRPRYGKVWLEISLCLLMMIGGFIAHLLLTARFGNALGMEIGIVFAIWIGFWLNALLTFGHEAAHYNLSPSRTRNDLLADWTIWLFFPQTTKAYRKSHWQHHLHLGDPEDTEISYHNCLSPWFLTKALTGIYLISLVIRYVFGQKGKTATYPDAPPNPRPALKAAALVAPVRALTIHGIFVSAALYLHCYASAITWLVAAALVFPFLATVRQVLEHRSADAACATDFHVVNHGPVNRLFGKNFFSRFYGAAGFNRHLLHHWDPTVSYTRFDEMESFFSGTSMSPQLTNARSTYLSSLILLTRKALRDRS
jgi:fatty acid desaturase